MKKLAVLALFLIWAGMSVAAVPEEDQPDQASIVDPLRVSATTWLYEQELRRAGFRPEDLCVHSIGQSHIDAAWRWRLDQTHRKVYRTWSQALKYMNTHPDYTFSGSAPQYYQWLLQDHPEVFAEVVRREREGRWEIVGGSWIEPDGNIPDGESYVRHRLEGQRFYLQHFGHIATIEWMLDSFGYNRNLPQIVTRSGAKYMWTSKLTWNKETVFPFHNFWWRSLDGSQVLTHICPISPMPVFFPMGEITTYKSTRYLLKPGVELIADYSTPANKIAEALSTDWNNEIGIFYGLGDGGLGPREIEIKIQEALARKGYAHASRGIDLFQHLERQADRFPVWNDEMYLEYHQGVMTTQAWIKRANRKAEQMLHSAEGLRSVLHLYGVTYPLSSLKEIWQLLLLNHFHDILPGSSIPEVYEDARRDFARIQVALREVTNAGLAELARMVEVKPPEKGLEAMVIFNALAWPRAGLVSVEVPAGRSFQVLDPGGAVLISQAGSKDGKNFVMFRTGAIPSLGYDTYYLKEAPADAPADPAAVPASAEPAAAVPALAEGCTAGGAASGLGVRVEEREGEVVIENQFARVVIDKKTGLMKSLREQESGRELLSRPSNRLLAWYDRPTEYSAWNIDPGYQEHPIALPEAAEVTVTVRGPLFVEVLARRSMKRQGYTTVFEQRVRLVDNDPVIYLDVDSDFHLLDSLVKLEFNTNLVTDTLAVDGPYLVLEKPTHPQTPAERARWEMACQKWIDLSEAELGLTLLNNGKYGFSLTADGKGFRQTIVKGARYPRANPGAYNVKHHYQSFPIPTGFTDQGAQHMELGLLIHKGDWRSARLWEAGYNFNTPFEVVRTGAHRGSLPAAASLISVESDHVYLGAVKRADDDGDLIVRLIEATGQPGTVVVNIGQGRRIKAAVETDLLELNPAPLSPSGSSLSVEMGPYQIRTFKLKIGK